MESLHNPKCFNSHMGVWVAKPAVIESKKILIQRGQLKAVSPKRKMRKENQTELESLGVQVVNRVAIIAIDDVMMKQASKFGGVSTTLVRRKLRAAARENEIRSIILYIDSPGGHVDGQSDLLDDIRAVQEIKPVYSYISNMGASAAYWAASITNYICCGRMSVIGSIGAYAVLYDSSKAYELAGVRVIRVASGEKKGLGIEGAPIDETVIESVQSEVNQIHEFFVSDVKSGRPKWNLENQDGSIFWGDGALAEGLVDEVNSWSNFLTKVTQGQVMPKEEEQDVIVQSPRADAASKVRVEERPNDEDGEDEKDKKIRDLEQENAELRGRLEELEKVDGLDSEKDKKDDEEEDDPKSQEDEEEEKKKEDEEEEKMAAKRLSSVLRSKGINVVGDSVEKIVGQLESAKMDGPPSSEGPKESPKKHARRVLTEYKKKYGYAKGGRLFLKEEPRLAEVLSS